MEFNVDLKADTAVSVLRQAANVLRGKAVAKTKEKEGQLKLIETVIRPSTYGEALYFLRTQTTCQRMYGTGLNDDPEKTENRDTLSVKAVYEDAIGQKKTITWAWFIYYSDDPEYTLDPYENDTYIRAAQAAYDFLKKEEGSR